MSADQSSRRAKRKRSNKERYSTEHARKRNKQSSNDNDLAENDVGASGDEELATNGQLHPNGAEKERGETTEVKELSGKELAKADKKSRRRQKKLELSLKKLKSRWYLTEPIGGHIMDIEPIVSEDERYLFIASQRAVHVYLLSTSLLARTLQAGSSEIISGYAISTSNPKHLYISTFTGLIILWDWISGKKIARWKTGVPINSVAVSQSRNTKLDIVYTLLRAKNSTITAHSLRSGDDAAKTVSTVLLTLKETIRNIQVLGQGSTVIANFSNTVMIGQRANAPKADEAAPKYVWRELKIPELVTCLDARLKAVSGPNTQTDCVDLAVGSIRGEIFVYEDILNKMIMAEKGTAKSKSNSTAPRILHWHRTELGAVRWALDGNYIVSGGNEGVLAMWQLSTGKRQDLPHLTSAIESITVASSAASYAIRLADNSVMVLSTTDFKPKANVAWIQSQVAASPQDKADIGKSYKIPAVLNPRKASELLLAVPTSQLINSKDRQPFPYLQTYDIFQGRHISRQAITRNNATNFMTAPDRTRLLEPNITHIQINADGSWLATAEEWHPPQKDIEHTVGKDDLADEQTKRREVYLKFWQWNQQKEQWTLESRIDNPHEVPGTTVSGKVYGLVVRPDKLGFASIGEDGVVKTWEPATPKGEERRFQGPKESKGQVVTWRCRHAITLERKPEIQDIEPDLGSALYPSQGCLAYSSDGSVLAVSQSFHDGSSETPVHYLDTNTGTITHSQAPLTHSTVVAMEFVGQFLVLLSERLTVWDLVSDTLQYSVSLRPSRAAPSPRHSLSQLAANPEDGTIAVSVPPQPGSPSAARSTVFVFSTASPNPLWAQPTPAPIAALLPARGSKGYVLLDAAAEVRALNPQSAPSATTLTPSALAFAPEDRPGSPAAHHPPVLAFAEGARLTRAEEDDDDGEREAEEGFADDDDDEGKPVVRPEQLAEIFDVGPAHALPSMSELFLAVAQLYGRKPRAAARREKAAAVAGSL